MFHFLPGPLKGSISFLFIALNTLFWAAFLYPVALAKFVIPIRSWRTLAGRVLIWIAVKWIDGNIINFRIFHRTRWTESGIDSLSRRKWYLVLSNHQTWVDILVLQKVFQRKIPFLKFFIKKSLIWFPVLGLAWWALDFPFMKRYSKVFLEKHPHLKGKDLETTIKACERFKTIPTSVMNFVEGTRFSPEKRDRQRSPYRHLLRPRAGGTAFVLGAMGDQFSSILDVTIVYPEGARDLWQFLCGRVSRVVVTVAEHPVRPDLIGNYDGDEVFRERFQEWLNTHWAEKDRKIAALLADSKNS